MTKEELLSKENLYIEYMVNQKSSRQLASEFKMGKNRILTKLKEYGFDKQGQLSYFKINELQHDLIIGNILGDGSLMHEGGNYKFKNRHAENQKEYCQFKLNMLVDFCKTKELHVSDGNKKASKNSQLMYYFNTRALPCFNKYGEMELVDVIKSLNLNSFSIWLMDDGYLAKKGNTLNYTLSVARFNDYELQAIENKLKNEFNLVYTLHKYDNNDKKQGVIYFPVSETMKINDIILNSDFSDELIKTMSYKIASHSN